MFAPFHLRHTVKGDVSITDSTIGAVAGPGAHIETANVVSQLHPSSKDEGTCMSNDTSKCTVHLDRERERFKK